MASYKKLYKEGMFVGISMTVRDGQLHTVRMSAGIGSIPESGAVGRRELTSKNTEQCTKLLSFPPAG